MTNICPCGRPIEQKPGESEAAVKKRKYCNGILVPKTKVQRRVGHGLLHYLYSRPV